jgi:hypothetical protein
MDGTLRRFYMPRINKIDRLFQRIRAGLMVLVLLPVAGTVSQVFAHGGEDHGEQKVVATTQNGMVSRSARVGDFEVLLKHPALLPDTATSARLFMTHFATNEAASDVEITAEIEATNGTVNKIQVERTDAAGSYVVQIPPLPEGHYTFRATLKVNARTETATLSDISVGHDEPAIGVGSSWGQSIATAVLFLIGAGLFGAFIYSAVHALKNGRTSDDAVAA